ncbi:MAG TPA: hypothetical protein VHN15_01175 [Thermoanaerobaculia bacterium]|nr:hypothetical protein [Thermoanaerobaculia bacterium]
MLIDEYLPTYSAIERHATTVRAPASIVYQAIRSADLAGAVPVRILMALRLLPSALMQGRRGLTRLSSRASEPITLAGYERQGFAILEEDPPREILIGLVGAFWTLGGGIRTTNADHFRGPQERGTARAAWNFLIQEQPGGGVTLSTETRVQPADPESERHFRRYWRLVQPWSGLTRLYMLRAIRREAERLAISENDPTG